MQPINPNVRRWRQEATDDPEGFWGRAAEQLLAQRAVLPLEIE